MNHFRRLSIGVIFLGFLIILNACVSPGNNEGEVQDRSTLQEGTFVVGNTPNAVSQASGHRIGVRVVNGEGEFFDRLTGEKFVPRGNNYVRLDPQMTEGGSTQIYHSVFDPEFYDQGEIIDAFDEMESLGYNSLRVFISQNTILAGNSLDSLYMQNIIDFLNLAGEHGLFVIFTLDWVPGGKYSQVLNQDCCENFNMYNASTLPPAGLEANILFFQDFVTYLIEHNAPLDAIFSFQLRNELYYEMNFPPLSLDAGILEGANGKSYDMSIPEDKIRMADENMVFWINTLYDAIKEIDPTALVSAGFFWPQEPNPARIGDPRYINTAPAIWETSLDFIDLHAYPASELTLEQYTENFGINGNKEKPIIMGEFGVSTASIPSVDSAAKILMDWQAASCDFGFDGWLLWAWDIHEFDDFYNAKSGDGQIGKVLAPTNRPDPCQIKEFNFFESNAAINKSVTASRALSEQPASNIVDGTGNQWGSGALPPQWIQIDLGQPVEAKEIRLTVSQYPDGDTAHEIYLGLTQDDLELAFTFEEYTSDLQILTFTPEVPMQPFQFVRIVTTKSPSWVSWKEIEVIER